MTPEQIKEQIIDYLDWSKGKSAPTIVDHVHWWLMADGQTFKGTPVVRLNTESGDITVNGKRLSDAQLQSFSDYVVKQINEFFTPEHNTWYHEGM